ncbi:MAG: hypothetical protein E6J29_10035 [Chloroflexi bacterium]|nr:MAG: hypothetical protein E6J29_10035 [Chloroflexota bacterium]TMD54772.1 MAG: hypothetical protein E6I85_05320 [Chloroflexota bacterium]
MYGPASSELVQAMMADRHRAAKQVALENAAKLSLSADRPAKRSWSSRLIALAVAPTRPLLARRRRAAARLLPN